MALLKRLRTGEVNVARTSLAANSALLQAPYMYDYEGRKAFAEPSGPDALGEHALYRVYATLGSEHIFVAATPEIEHPRRDTALRKIASQTGLSLTPEMPDEDVATKLTMLLGDLTTAESLEIFKSVGVTAVKMNSLHSLRETYTVNVADQAASEHQTYQFYTQDAASHPIGAAVTMFAPCAVRSLRAKSEATSEANMNGVLPKVSPKYGAHTTEVLRDVLGYEEAHIDKLIAQGVVSTRWSELYLPGGDPWSKVKREYAQFIEDRIVCEDNSTRKRRLVDASVHSEIMSKRIKGEPRDASWLARYESLVRPEE